MFDQCCVERVIKTLRCDDVLCVISNAYRGTWLIRKRTLLGPYRSLCLQCAEVVEERREVLVHAHGAVVATEAGDDLLRLRFAHEQVNEVLSRFLDGRRVLPPPASTEASPLASPFSPPPPCPPSGSRFGRLPEQEPR